MSYFRKFSDPIGNEGEKTLLKLKIIEALKLGNKPLADYYKAKLAMKEEETADRTNEGLPNEFKKNDL